MSTATPATPAEALRWYADSPECGMSPEGRAWSANLRRWADDLDAARSTDPGPAPDGIPVDRSGFEVTVVAAENIDRADSGRRVDAKVLASTAVSLAYELAALACDYHLVAAKQAIADWQERAPLSSVPPGTEADQ